MTEATTLPIIPDPATPPTIIKAEQDVDEPMIWLTFEGQTQATYILNETDPYGWSPALREQLAAKVEAGEITITDRPVDPTLDPAPEGDPPPGISFDDVINALNERITALEANSPCP